MIRSIRLLTLLSSTVLAFASTALAGGPSFDCAAKGLGEVESLICKDAAFAALDREIAATYKQALAKAGKGTSNTLAVEQRGWIKGRNDCWKDTAKAQCITDQYLRRLAELQARYGLIAPRRSVTYHCDNKPAHELVARYYATKRASVVVEHGDDSFLLFADSKAGDHYTGRNEQLKLEGKTIKFVPGFEAPPIACVEAK